MDKAKFFDHLSSSLKEIFTNQDKNFLFKKCISNDLYMRSRFILAKRAAIISKNLNKMIAF